MRNLHSADCRGMTLIELMISLSIITVMVGLISGALANYLNLTTAARNAVNLVGHHERVVRQIRQDLLQSSTNRSSQKQWWVEDGGKTLRLRKLAGFALDSKGAPSLAWSSDVTYSLDSDDFVTRTQDGTATRIAGSFTQLTFEEIDNGRVRITLSNQMGSAARNTLSTLATTIEVTPLN